MADILPPVARGDTVQLSRADYERARKAVAEMEATNTRLQEQLKEARFRPLGDNHHNAAACPYCSPKIETNTPLKEALREVAMPALREAESLFRQYGEPSDSLHMAQALAQIEDALRTTPAGSAMLKAAPAVTGTTSDKAPVRNPDAFEKAARAAAAYLAAHTALAAAGVSEERPAAARRLADAWIALTRACAELPKNQLTKEG